MRTYQSDTYFKTQSEALNHVFDMVKTGGKYTIEFPENIWTEHVNYGTSVHYHLPLIVSKTGNPAKKWLHITLYRMDSGNYELTYYQS